MIETARRILAYYVENCKVVVRRYVENGTGGRVGSIRMTQVTALVLRAVAAGYRYGFDIMEAAGLPSGTVYPALRRLDKAGLLASTWEKASDAHADGRPRRRIYALTADGRAALAEAEAKLAEVRAMLGSLPPAETGEA